MLSRRRVPGAVFLTLALLWTASHAQHYGEKGKQQQRFSRHSLRLAVVLVRATAVGTSGQGSKHYSSAGSSATVASCIRQHAQAEATPN
jgi:hypothetical protein